MFQQSTALAQRFESVLGRAAGIRSAALNPRTGSLLLEFDSSDWRTADGTRAFLSALAELLSNYCSSEALDVPWGDSTAIRDSLVRALGSAQGIAGLDDDPATGTLHVRFDPQFFALEPVLRAMLGTCRAASAV